MVSMCPESCLFCLLITYVIGIMVVGVAQAACSLLLVLCYHVTFINLLLSIIILIQESYLKVVS